MTGFKAANYSNMNRSQAMSRMVPCALRRNAEETAAQMAVVLCALLGLILVNIFGLMIIIT